MKFFNLFLLCYLVQGCGLYMSNGTSRGSTTPDFTVLNQSASSSIGNTMTSKRTTIICGPDTATNANPGNASIPCLAVTATITQVVLVHAQTLTCQVNEGVVSCPPVVCPGDQVTFTSTVQNAVNSNLWVLPNGTCSGSTPPDSIALPQTAGFCKGITMTCGPYTATNADPGSASFPCLTSTLTVTATSSMTSSVIQVGTQNVLGNTAIVDTTLIMVEAPPGPPNVMAQTIGPDMVQVVMSPSPNGGLPTSYNVTISNSSYMYTSSPVVMANGSAMVTFTGLGNVSTCNISVVAINCAGNNSTQSYISWPASPSPSSSLSLLTTSSSPSTLPSSVLPATTQPQSPDSTGAIVGGVVGGVGGAIVLAVVIAIVVVVVCKKKGNATHHQDTQPAPKYTDLSTGTAHVIPEENIHSLETEDVGGPVQFPMEVLPTVTRQPSNKRVEPDN